MGVTDKDVSLGMEVNTSSRDWGMANTYRMRHHRGARATVPGGHEIAIEPDFLDVQPPGAEYDGIVDKIHDFLKHPKPGCAHIWRPRQDDSTYRLIELHYIRPVLYSELKENAVTIHLYGYSEAGIPDANGERCTQTCVGWRKMGLYEVRPDISKEWFVDPGRWHLRLIAEIPERVNNEFEEAGIGTAVVERKDPASQAQEVARDQRRGR